MNNKQSITIGYEIQGLRIDRALIPWNADSLLVEMLIRFPPKSPCAPKDFLITMGDDDPLIGNEIQITSEGEFNSGKVLFRADPPVKNVTAKVYIKNKLRHEMAIPFLSREKFLKGLSFNQASLSCLYDQGAVACKSYYPAGIRNMSIGGIIKSVHGFEPLLGTTLALALTMGKNKKILPWTPNIPQAGEAMIPLTIPLGTFPRKMGVLESSLLVDGEEIGGGKFQGLSTPEFLRTIEILRAGFVVWNENNMPHLWDNLDSLKAGHRFGPTFWLHSDLQDCVGLADGKINGYLHGSVQPMTLWEGKIPITHVPRLFSPLSMASTHFQELKLFELVIARHPVSRISLASKPKAIFTNEGTIASPVSMDSESPISNKDLLKKLNSLANPN